MKTQLSPEIIINLLILTLSLSIIPAHGQDTANARFQRLDRNNDGKLSYREVSATVNQELFQRLDRNGDGNLTPDEVPARRVSRNEPETSKPSSSAAQHLNIPYKEAASGVDPTHVSLDIYAAEGSTDLPVMIYIHGGGWRAGDKSAVGVKPAFFNDLGFVFVSINYRLVPDVDILTQLQDSADAIGWVKRNIGGYGGDPARIHLIGHSAGAHHVAILATNEQFINQAGVGLKDIKSVIELDTQALDVVELMQNNSNGLYEQAFGKDPAVWERISPRHNATRGKRLPAFLLFVADNRLQKIEQAEAFKKTLESAGAYCRFIESPGHDHGSLNRAVGEPDDPVTREISAFLKEFLDGDRKPSSPKPD